MSFERGNQVYRQWRLLKALRARRMTLLQLAFIGEVCTRTIRRDLEVLGQVGFPIVRSEGLYHLSEDFL